MKVGKRRRYKSNLLLYLILIIEYQTHLYIIPQSHLHCTWVKS